MYECTVFIQGFGAGCDGFGGELSPRNGLR